MRWSAPRWRIWSAGALIPLNFNQQRVEADFRYALVRLRDNAEGIALYGGEADEKRGLVQRFQALIENWWAIMVATKRLTFFTAGYSQVATVFPFVVAAPAYFAGRIPLGGLTQTANAFGEVQGALSWFVDNYAIADRMARHGEAHHRLPRRDRRRPRRDRGRHRRAGGGRGRGPTWRWRT